MTGSINITPVGLDCALVYILEGNDIPLKIIVIILNNIQVLKRREKEKKNIMTLFLKVTKKAIMSFAINSAFQLIIASFKMMI